MNRDKTLSLFITKCLAFPQFHIYNIKYFYIQATPKLSDWRTRIFLLSTIIFPFYSLRPKHCVRKENSVDKIFIFYCLRKDIKFPGGTCFQNKQTVNDANMLGLKETAKCWCPVVCWLLPPTSLVTIHHSKHHFGYSEQILWIKTFIKNKTNCLLKYS